MLICRNAQGVHGQKKVGNPWTKALIYRALQVQNGLGCQTFYRIFIKNTSQECLLTNASADVCRAFGCLHRISVLFVVLRCRRKSSTQRHLLRQQATRRSSRKDDHSVLRKAREAFLPPPLSDVLWSVHELPTSRSSLQVHAMQGHVNFPTNSQRPCHVTSLRLSTSVRRSGASVIASPVRM